MGDNQVSRVEDNVITTRNSVAEISTFLTKSFDDYAIDDISIEAIPPDQYGYITIQKLRILPNNNREQCPYCDKYYKDREMLERQYFDTNRTCTRCGMHTWMTCKYGLEAWSRRPHCHFGCEECLSCFAREEEQELHNKACHSKRDTVVEIHVKKHHRAHGNGGKAKHTRRNR